MISRRQQQQAGLGSHGQSTSDPELDRDSSASTSTRAGSTSGPGTAHATHVIGTVTGAAASTGSFRSTIARNVVLFVAILTCIFTVLLPISDLRYYLQWIAPEPCLACPLTIGSLKLPQSTTWTTDSIPRILHIFEEDITTSLSHTSRESLLSCRNSWLTHHKNWQVMRWSASGSGGFGPRDVRRWVYHVLPGYYGIFIRLGPSSQRRIAKFLVLYYFGGVYVDTSALRSLAPIVTDEGDSGAEKPNGKARFMIQPRRANEAPKNTAPSVAQSAKRVEMFIDPRLFASPPMHPVWHYAISDLLTCPDDRMRSSTQLLFAQLDASLLTDIINIIPPTFVSYFDPSEISIERKIGAAPCA